MQKYLTLNDITAYKSAFRLSNQIWHKIQQWNFFAKDTIGKQYMKAIDSIGANIAEGFGRYTKKDKIHFYRISYGSCCESLDWTAKSYHRKLMSKEEYLSTIQILKQLQKEIFALIKFTNEKLTI